MCAGLVLAGHRLGHPIATGVLAVLAVGAERESIRLTPAVEVSVASLLCVFAAVVFGPLSAVVVGGAGLLADLPRRDVAQPILRWMTWTSIRVIVAGAAGLDGARRSRAPLRAASGASSELWPLHSSSRRPPTLALTAVAPAIRATGYRGRTRSGQSGPALSRAFRFRRRWWPFLRTRTSRSLLGASRSSRFLPLPPRGFSFCTEQQRETSEALGAANARLASANLSFATALVATLDARDRYTAGHSAAVAIYARDIAKRMGAFRARAGTGSPVRARPRRGKDRPTGRSSREAWRAAALRSDGRWSSTR